MKGQRFWRTRLRELVRAVKGALDHNAQDFAATIAFWTFFSIFPLLIAVLALAGYYVESSRLTPRIFQALTDLLPGSASLVRESLESILRHRSTFSGIGIVGLLWTAGSGFGAITRAVNRALGDEKDRFYLVSSMRHFIMAVAVSILMVTWLGITMAVEFILSPSTLARLGIQTVEIPRLPSWAFSFALIFSMFSLIYKLAPWGRVRWTEVLPGALFAAVLFELGKTAFVLYLNRAAHFQAIYGPLASISVLLLWLYVSAVILIIGAEYNIVRWKARTAARRDSRRK